MTNKWLFNHRNDILRVIPIMVAAIIFGIILKSWHQNTLRILGILLLTLWLVRDLRRGLIVGIVAVNMSGYRFDIGLTETGITIRPEHIVFSSLFISWSILLLLKKAHIRRTPLDIPILGYLAANLISSLFIAENKAASLYSWFILVVYTSFYFITVNILLDSKDACKRITTFFILFGTAHCLYGLIAVFADFLGVNIGGIQLRGLPMGMFQESNLFAIFATCILMFHIARVIVYPMWDDKRTYFYLLICVSAIVLAATRSAWVSLPFGLLVILLINKSTILYRKNIKKFNRALVLITGVFCFTFLIIPNLIISYADWLNTLSTKLMTGFSFSAGSGLTRIMGWQTALSEWSLSPVLGCGTMTASVLGIGYSWLWSSFIQTLHDAGIVGLIFILITMIKPITFLRKRLYIAQDYYKKYIFTGFIAGCIVLLITCQFSNFLWLGFPWVFYGIAVANGMYKTNK